MVARAPGGHEAAFTAQITAEEVAEHMRLTVAAYEDYQRCDLPSGPGARDLITSFQAADQVLNRHDPGPITVIDDSASGTTAGSPIPAKRSARSSPAPQTQPNR